MPHNSYDSCSVICDLQLCKGISVGVRSWSMRPSMLVQRLGLVYFLVFNGSKTDKTLTLCAATVGKVPPIPDSHNQLIQ